MAVLSFLLAAAGVAGASTARTPTQPVPEQKARAGKPPADAQVGDSVDRAAYSVLAKLQQSGISSDAGRAVDYQTRTVTVYTTRAMSPALRKALARAAAPVSLRIVKPVYSVASLAKEAARLAGEPGVHWAQPNSDYSGLIVGVDPKRVRAATLSTSGFPVRMEAAPKPVVPATRDADSAPAWGGALIFRSTSATAGIVCSVGVGVNLSGTTTLGVTTAEHCGGPSWTGYGSGAAIGTSYRYNKGHDVQVLTGHSGGARAWIGPWNSGSTQLIYRGADPADGAKVCTDGGVTGETCGNNNVRGVNLYVPIAGFGTVGPGYWVLSTNGVSSGRQSCNVQPGDSGSPSYQYNSDSRLTVNGLVVAQDTNFSTAVCKGNPDFWPGNFPSARAFAVNISEALTSISTKINTG